MEPDRVCAALRRLASRGADGGPPPASGLSPKDRRALLEAADLIERAYPPSAATGSDGGIHLVMSIDGAARGNPGPAGIGVVIGQEHGTYRRELSEYIGEATNNAAEYQALLLALKEAAKLQATGIRVRSDSELLVRQMEGRYRVKHPRLSELHARARDLIRAFRSFQIEHVRRELNREADALANRAIDRALDGSRRDKGCA
jgi:ribonuclease HI